MPDTADQLRALDARGLLGEAIPELENTRGALQPKEHYWDVFQHSVETVRAVPQVIALPFLPPDRLDPQRYFAAPLVSGYSRLSMLKLAALLHDVGKPATKTFEANGRMRFFGHPKVGAALATTIAERLGLPPEAVQYVALLVEEHLRPGQIGSDDRITDRAIRRFFRDTNGAGIDILYLNLADHVAMRGPLLTRDELLAHAALDGYVIGRWYALASEKRPQRLIDGHELMRALELSPGPEVGRLLEAIEQARRRGKVRTREEAVALARRLERRPGQTS